MKVLLIGNHFHDKAHNQNAWHDLASYLRNAGMNVRTTSGQTGKIHRLGDMLWTIWRDRQIYDLALIDVFSGSAFIWAYLSGWMLNILGKPFVLTLHGGNLPAFAREHPNQVRSLLSSADRVTSPSTYLQKQLDDFGADILLIPNALDVKTYPNRNRADPQPSLVWLRTFHRIYNPSLAPRVLSRLKNQGLNVHLLMVGPDKGDGSLQQVCRIAQELGVADQMEFPGGVKKVDVPLMLDNGDIFINTTNIDNTPVSVIEAMACGLCVVSTDVGGIPYLLEDGKDALLVPPDDPEAMASAVRRILTEPGLAGKLSANARKKVEQFDWSVILPRWEALFDELIGHD